MSPPLMALLPTLPLPKYLVFALPSLSAPEVLRVRGSVRLGVNRDLSEPLSVLDFVFILFTRAAVG